jgi:hypothetical protein
MVTIGLKIELAQSQWEGVTCTQGPQLFVSFFWMGRAQQFFFFGYKKIKIVVG